jgi:hypothetical protein
MVRGKDAKDRDAPQPGDLWSANLETHLNGTTITVGCNDIFGQDPPRAFGEGGNAEFYPGGLYDSVGRFLYVSLDKKF